MAEELASSIRFGKRMYRTFPIRSLQGPPVVLNPKKLSLLEEDDGESEDEERVNIDINDFEEMTNQRHSGVVEEAVTETIRFNEQANVYIMSYKLPLPVYYQLCGGCSLDKTALLREIESCSGALIKGDPNTQVIEIRANGYDQVVIAHSEIIDKFKITPRPTEYQVMIHHTVVVIKSNFNPRDVEDEPQAEEIKIDEYPMLEMKYDNYWKGYITRVLNFPKDCADFLLADNKKNIRKLQAEMNENVIFEVKRQESCLEVIGYTENQVRDGYAAFVRLVKTDRSAESFAQSRPALDPPKALNKKPKNVRNFTHFVSVGFQNNSELTELQKEINKNIPGMPHWMTNPPNRFHITIAVLSLTNPQPVIEALKEIESNLKSITIGNPLLLTFDKLGYFGKPNAANVLFVDLLHDQDFNKLNEISSKVHQVLMQKGILTRGDLQKQKTEMKGNTVKKVYHLTLAKTKGSNKPIDLTRLLELGMRFNIKAQVTEIELLSMDTASGTASYPSLFKMRII